MFEVRVSIDDKSCLLDASAQVQRLLDTYLPQVVERQGMSAGVMQRPRSTFDSSPRLGLPAVNWPAHPVPKLNQLYWPQGATRWGTFFALMPAAAGVSQQPWRNGDTSDDATEALTLKLETVDGFTTRTLELSMYAVEPMPIVAGDSANWLWLVPLVDERYFWQTASVDLSDGQGSWSALRGEIETALSITIDVDGSEVGYPDPFEFAGVQCAGQLIDAMCWSAGMRFVVGFDGTYAMQSKTEADSVRSTNLENDAAIAAGSNQAVEVPNPNEGYRVVFRKLVDNALMPPDDLYQVTDGGTFKTALEVSAFATFTASEYFSDPDDPSNASGLDTLADDIFKGVHWNYETAYFYDFTANGLPNWTPGGWDDCLIVNVGTLENERLMIPMGASREVFSKFDNHLTTRVKSLASGVTVRHVCTSLDGENYGRLNQLDVVIASCDATVATSDATFDATVVSCEAGYVEVGTTIEVNNMPASSDHVFSGASGAYVKAKRYGGEGSLWYWDIGECPTP